MAMIGQAISGDQAPTRAAAADAGSLVTIGAATSPGVGAGPEAGGGLDGGTGAATGAGFFGASASGPKTAPSLTGATTAEGLLSGRVLDPTGVATAAVGVIPEFETAAVDPITGVATVAAGAGASPPPPPPHAASTSVEASRAGSTSRRVEGEALSADEAFTQKGGVIMEVLPLIGGDVGSLGPTSGRRRD